jgi:hypothetical protein
MNNTQLKFDWDIFMEKTIKKIGKDNLINYILNEKNRVITKDYIKNTLQNYGIEYQVNDLKLFTISMTHSSYINKDWLDSKNFKMIFMGINLINGDMLVPIGNDNKEMAVSLGKISYERLEFLGDVLIGATSLGFTEHVGVLRGLIQTKIALGAWKERLLQDPTLLVEAYLAQGQAQSA